MKKIILSSLLMIMFLAGCGNKKMEEFSKSKGCDYCTESQIKSLVEKANKGDNNAREQVIKNYKIWGTLAQETIKSDALYEEIKKQADIWSTEMREIKNLKIGDILKTNPSSNKTTIIPQKMW